MDNQEFNYMVDVETLLLKKRKQLLGNKSCSNKAELFRTNYEAFSKIISFYKRYPGLAKELGESAVGEIKKILLANNHINALDDISNAQVNNYMSDAREYFGQKKKESASTRNRGKVNGRYENFNLSSEVLPVIEEEAHQVKPDFNPAKMSRDSVTHELNWSDDSSIYPLDITELDSLRLKDRPKEWSDYWEKRLPSLHV